VELGYRVRSLAGRLMEVGYSRKRKEKEREKEEGGRGKEDERSDENGTLGACAPDIRSQVQISLASMTAMSGSRRDRSRYCAVDISLSFVFCLRARILDYTQIH